MGKRTLKYGGKSGILPRVRPIFRHNPIKPKTKEELADEAKVEQGYVEGVPLPQRKGFKFFRSMREKPVITVEERIKRNIEDRAPGSVDTAKLSTDELWQLKRDEIRRAHLKEAYIKEKERLDKLEELKLQKKEKSAASRQNATTEFEESEATKLTLPTIESYLKGPIMRHRTEEEDTIIKQQRTLNRKVHELANKEERATQLLDLYHSAANFITTEEELEVALKEAFEVSVGKFDSNQMLIENKLSGYSHALVDLSANENMVLDAAYGEIKGQPGLNIVKDTIDGQIERLKREAQLKAN